MTPAARALELALSTLSAGAARAFFLRAEALGSAWQTRIDAEQSNKTAHDRLAAAGWTVTPHLSAEARRPLGLVLLTRHKEESFANLARAWSMLEPEGTLLAAGSNVDGAASIERHAEAAFGVVERWSKHHCRVFRLRRTDRAPPDYWTALSRPHRVPDGGWWSDPALFCWDRIDDGSALLALHLPGDLRGHVADFGCGWGYLAREILARAPSIERLDAIDIEHRAVEAARRNLDASRAACHWLDLAVDPAPARYDAILCNPPFHADRAADPTLGTKIIEAAARALKPGGRLLLVANRGLPYAPVLQRAFTSVEQLADNNKFRVWRAVR
ncbi:MAG: class I SAM-dependent methyltransferase [Alphaproteobacteria bacterium]|nr:class I SAM-dependent methyltransferase [Alphaproteobacteria bacterium]